jgi:membrane protease YdiL (CAAX protease family)
MHIETQETIKRMGLLKSFSLFIPAALMLMVETHYLIPYLSRKTGQETILFWFIVAGVGMFLPLLLIAMAILRVEGYGLQRNTWRERLRFKPLTRRDLVWSIGSLVTIGFFSVVLMKGLERAIGPFDHSPPFLVFEPLTSGRYWLLAMWLPFWILNIMGEEIMWRGVMLPRQETALGRNAWLVNAGGWALFHVAFGWRLLVTLLPILVIQPYVVQKRRNSWVGVIIHAGMNGPIFLAVAFGIL